MNMAQVDLVSLFTIGVLMQSFVLLLIVSFYYFLRPIGQSFLPDSALPSVSIIVPARNEELKVERCLKSLVQQDYPNYEIVVVDDLSTDRTGEIINAMARKYNQITAVSGSINPDGWIGKCNALVQAVSHASGEWLIFTDADTCHKPDSLRQAVNFAIKNQVDLVSFVPVQELGSFWERAIMPPLLGSFLMGDCFHMVNWPNTARAYAYGQYVMARRSSYHAVGGHQSVRDEIVEDHALARLFKSNGHRVAVADGRSLYKVRMYLSLGTLWQGWVKNLYSFTECNPLLLVMLLLALSSALLGPFVGLAIAGWMFASTQGSTLSLVLLSLAGLQLGELFLSSRLMSRHLEGVSWYHFFLFPLGGLMIDLLYLTSAFKVISGSDINWKGRTYRVTSARTISRSYRNSEFKPVED